ncbi:E3 ubiquitin-protein ligase UPL4 isoform X1 [Sesamum indicum]|uniref:HECT-type E3 ubiquitin transferase n=2 Tax=Sesamum indicum TaxID=4182 RepID=A0A6I9U655_SESIN|nr:E3 ubiquitin-protein ligase UPL4 isoform X1 [Sesamum indicum]XP_011094717.1 E3 ubiquitin-protein ligase UPL4 isoform X1 [Sesamum indicum]XP_020553305.1 E3 ubiquitin-protein ligase UPL4 isoform X1 [Sesamum indicum]XP_020553306.1 E3 ubiquitin-protein ligase UPL4 isoform X1 [Sesamum indicum]
MANRGQKRTEVVDGLPADKRACSSLEFRPSSSNSSAQTPMSSAHEAQDADMDTSSSTSGSTRSEGDGEKESAYGSCDSDNSIHDYYRHRSMSDQSKFKKVLSSLSEEVEESGQLALLTELCELLSFCTDSSLSSLMVDSFSPVLVRLARHESNPDIMLLAIRAITYLCDVNPRSSGFLVRHDAVPVLCQRLMAIEYLDVAEQCLQAMEKISREQPLACLQSGAIMAVLSYIDFFSTSVQRVALSTVVNICKKLSSESPPLFMEAVPILCNLLQYEDRQLVESVATCLIKIGEQVYCSAEMLDDICKHGLVQHILHLIGLNSRTTLCQPTYIGLIGLLVKLAAGSIVAFRTLFELNISNTVKDMLSTYDLSHGTLYVSMVGGHHSQIHEVLKLLNELLPAITEEQDGEQKSDKEVFLLSHPDIVQKFGVDLLPILIQVVNSGVNLLICYGCLSVINKLVRFSSSGALHCLLQTANFSSFLAGVFTRKDHHVIILALQIVDTITLKLPHVYLNSFVKEGVLFSIYALLSPDKDLKQSPVFDGIKMENDATLRSVTRDVHRCPCFTFDTGQSARSPENGTCKLQKDTVQNLAKHIWNTYFETESVNPEKGVTDILQKLRTLSSALTALVNKALEEATSSQQEKEIYDLLHQIMSELNDKDSISTFEFVESGIIKALVNYLSNGRHIVGREDNNAVNNLCIMEKRFELFGRLLLSCDNTAREEFPLLILIRRLQSALSSVENFPVISSHTARRRNSYATVPYGRCTSYPCLKVQFVREKGEVSLRDCADDVVNVDPFVALEEIEGYLLPRVTNGKTKILRSESKGSKEKDSSSSHSPSDSSICQAKSIDVIKSTEMLVDFHKLQDKESNLLLSSPADTSSSSQRIMDSADVADVQTDPLEPKEHDPLQEDGGTNFDHPGCSDCEETSPKLLFYLESQQLNCKLTLYQSILNLQTETDHDNISSASLWNRIYKLTYRRPVTTRVRHPKPSHDEAQCSLSLKRALFFQYTPYFCPMFASEVDLEKLGPTYDILSLLKSLEGINRLRFHLMSRERTYAFAEGRTDDLDKLNVVVSEVPPNEFVNKKLTEKLEQQMRDPMAVSVGAMPAWCTQLMAWCPFLFGFEARCKYFHLAALGRSPVQTHSVSHGNAGGSGGRQQSRRKILVHRNKILESAAQMMELHTHQKVLFEVEYDEEVGTGLGPTLEFYTLVCHEFQRSGLGMWRDDTVPLQCTAVLETENTGFLVSPFGLFPRPWSPSLSASSSSVYSDVIEKFSLLGYIVAKALQDGRVLDLPFSKALYKLILGKELSLYDIQSFDPASGRALLEFQAVVERKEYLRSVCKEESADLDVCLRNTKIEDLCLDFTLPGYPDYVLVPETDSRMVNLYNLDEYITLIVDATTKSGIARQVEAFKSGFDQVFPIKHLKVFTEEELERLLCGEHVLWNSEDLLDHIKFDHGYTISSPPIVNLLEIMQEFDLKQQRAFLQFVTGAPRLPTGGLASLNPKLTIVRKHCSKGIDADLPSVMTCANYLKLPPYSSKEVMKEKLLYAVTEGQGSFHLS